ncbi:MAG: hypothetical protein ACPGJV_15955 [Bacteriovoracaceae bacterium]
MKYLLSLMMMLSLASCGGFKAERVDSAKSDEKALEITDEWVAGDTERVIAEVVEKLQKHRGFKRYLRSIGGKAPALFVGQVQNLTSNAYFPINDLNDEFLNILSETGDFTLVDAAARDALLKEITYQNDGMVDPNSAKMVGKQTGADLIVFGNVYMKPQTRKGKTIKQYSINIRLTDIERGVEVARTRAKVSKYSQQSSSGW